MLMFKKILFMLSIVLFSNAYSFAQDYGIAYKDLEIILDKTWTVKIGCYLNGQSYTWKNENWEIACKGKNISIPPRSHLKYFKKYFKEKDWGLFCDESCLNMIANRWALVNFESSFNPNTISPTSDYGYIQVHNGKDFLWENKIQTSLDWLDNRWKEHGVSLCGNKYNITDWESDNMYKCLMLRHNGQKSLNNHYSLRGLSAKKFYLTWFDEQVKNTNQGYTNNKKLLAKIDEKQERMQKQIEEKKQKKINKENKKMQIAQENLLNKLKKMKTNKEFDLTEQIELPEKMNVISLGDWRFALLDKETEAISILPTP